VGLGGFQKIQCHFWRELRPAHSTSISKQCHVGKFTQKYSSFSFTRLIQADGGQGLSAQARVLATYVICSSPSTAASMCLGLTGGSTPDGSCQTG